MHFTAVIIPLADYYSSSRNEHERFVQAIVDDGIWTQPSNNTTTVRWR
jgi:hypothetical protein